MKKLISIICLITFTFVIPCFSEESVEITDANENWEEIGNQGKQLIKDVGSFFKNVGTQIGTDLEESGETTGKSIADAGIQFGNQLKDAAKELFSVKCQGTWVYKNKRTKNTLTINPDGTMELTQRTGIDIKYWQGYYSGTAHILTCDIHTEGERSFFKEKSKEVCNLWFITYRVEDDYLIITSNSIPTDESGTDFSTGIVFTKKE